MATVSPPRPRNLAEAQTKLRHPLDSLRRYIRLYIALEGAALVVLFLAAFFWAGLLLDYGPFVAFGFDWTDVLPRSVNLFLLLALFTGTMGLLLLGLLLVAAVVAFLRLPSPGLGIGFIVVLVLQFVLSVGMLFASAIDSDLGLVLRVVLPYCAVGVNVLMIVAIVRAILEPALSRLGWALAVVAVLMWAGAACIIGAAVWGLPMGQSRYVPWPLHLLVLVSALAGLAVVLGVRVGGRLWREFSDPALALVLERRFPKLLGDRLITAVELSDPQAAAELGYSRVMVEETIRDAAARVDQLPIREVFDWGRLYHAAFRAAFVLFAGLLAALFCFCVVPYCFPPGLSGARLGLNAGFFALLGLVALATALLVLLPSKPTRLTLVLALAAGAATLAMAAVPTVGRLGLSGERKVSADLHDFNDVARIYVERDLLLRGTPWPRQVDIVLIEPEEVELRIGKDAAPPQIRVRAHKYVVVDRTAPRGVRVARWQEDLIDRRDILPDAETPAPEDWKANARDRAAGLTIDEVEFNLSRFYVRKGGPGEPGGKDLPAKWNYSPTGKKEDLRPLYWKDLNREALGVVDVPAAWPLLDDSVIPYAAGLIGLGTGTENPLAALALLSGPPADNLLVDDVEARLPLVHSFLESVKADDRPADFGKLAERLTDVEHALTCLDRLHRLAVDLDRVEERASQPEMSRTFRKLRVPDEVKVVTRRGASTVEITLTRAPGNEYTGSFKQLEEGTLEYWAVAGDARTPKRKLTVMPPPAVKSLVVTEYRPAYLSFRTGVNPALPGLGLGGPMAAELRDSYQSIALSGLKRQMPPQDLSGFASEQVSLRVPAGSDLTIRLTIDKPLHRANQDGTVPAVRVENLKPEAPVTAVPKVLDESTFALTLEDVRKELHFAVVYRDEYRVQGRRVIRVTVEEDHPPDLRDVMPSIVRKTKDGYMVTVDARVPFKGRVTDDHGLAQVRYHYTVYRLESSLNVGLDTLTRVIGSGGLAASGGYTPLTAAGVYAFALQDARKDTKKKTLVARGTMPVPKFDETLAAGRETLPLAEVLNRLGPGAPPGKPLTSRFEMKADGPWPRARSKAKRSRPEDPVEFRDEDSKAANVTLECDFPVYVLGLKSSNPRFSQPQYELTLWVEATDTDADGERDAGGVPRPHVGESQERYTFLVVSEEDLLLEIRQEEKELRRKIRQVYIDLSIDSRANTRDKDEDDDGTADLPPSLEQVLEELTIDVKTRRAALPGMEPAERDKFLLGRIAALEKMEKNLAKLQDNTRAVHQDYDRIAEEYKVNQIGRNLQLRLNEDIVDRLDWLAPLNTKKNGLFDDARNSLRVYREALEALRRPNPAGFDAAYDDAQNKGEKAKADVARVNNQLKELLTQIQKLDGVKQLIQALEGIKKKEEIQSKFLEQVKKDLVDRLLGGGGTPDKP
jgi:hypothetical protein